MKNKSYRKYFTDGLLIVFSVLFALFINKLAENYETQQKKDLAILSIKKELRQNYRIIEKWNLKHIEISKRINNIIIGKEDSLKTELIKNKHFNFGIISNNENIVSEMPSNTAWETSKTIGIVSEFDFNTNQKLSKAYKLQQLVTEKTLMGIIDLIFNMKSNEIEQFYAILNQYQLRFREIVGQETGLKFYYKDAIENIK